MADPVPHIRPGAMRPVNDNNDAPPPTLAEAAIVLAGGRRAAVTLRLDPARHVRLRLACALAGRSAQAILSEALDAYFETIPGIERLAADAVADGGEQAATGRGTER